MPLDFTSVMNENIFVIVIKNLDMWAAAVPKQKNRWLNKRWRKKALCSRVHSFVYKK